MILPRTTVRVKNPANIYNSFEDFVKRVFYGKKLGNLDKLVTFNLQDLKLV